MERLVLVHGSVVGGRGTWGAQRPLAERFELVVLDRPGFPPNPPVERVDFAVDAELVAGLLEHGDHLVGHSYGGVIALLAAASRPDLVRSLTVIEPPATSVAPDDPAVAAFAAGGAELYAAGATDDPEAFLRRFLAAVGSDFVPPSPLPPDLEQGARALMVERGPGKRTSRWTRSPRPTSRSWSSRARTIRHSTESATRWNAGSAPSEPCSRATATRCSGTPSSTPCSRTSSSGPRAARPSGARRSPPSCRSRVHGGGRAGS